MRIPRLLFIVLAVALVGGALGLRATSQSPTVSALDTTDGHGRPEPPMLGVHYARGQAGKTAGAKTSPLLQYHGGLIQTSASQVNPIYWGAAWNSSNEKIAALDGFYASVGGSAYMGTNTEYTNANRQRVSALVSFGTHAIDSTAAAKNAPTTTAVLAVVARNFPNPTPNAYYPVYSDQPRGNAGYCAWHSWGYVGTVPVQFGFFFNLDNDPGCDPNDNASGHSQGIAALGNVTGHELSEMVTDPWGQGWYDRTGAENSDKCAWTFSNTLVTLGSTRWKIQGNFSNAAYNASRGYQRGCIDGNQ